MNLPEKIDKGYYRDEKGIIRKVKVVVNLTKGKKKSCGWGCSAHFTFYTFFAKTKESALEGFVKHLNLRNYEVNEK